MTDRSQVWGWDWDKRYIGMYKERYHSPNKAKKNLMIHG